MFPSEASFDGLKEHIAKTFGAPGVSVASLEPRSSNIKRSNMIIRFGLRFSEGDTFMRSRL